MTRISNDPDFHRTSAPLRKAPAHAVLCTPVSRLPAPSETSARYSPGASSGLRPGYFVVNTYKLDSRPKFEMEALALYESVPGHHLQLGLARELEGVPEFRRRLSVNAYTEGWGLYAESLGEEL